MDARYTGPAGAVAGAAGLFLAAHPGPTLAVTALAGALSITLRDPAGDAALLAAAVLAGQLSIGWSNDALDARRDRAAHRSGKPVARGDVGRRTVATAAFLALAACVALSLTTGAVAGAVHLVAVTAGWLYNVWLKRTPLSWLPFAVSFGLLPLFAAYAGDPARSAPVRLMVAAALLGVAAHLFNGLPDIPDDEAAGIRPLPVVLGPRATGWLGAAVLASTGVVLTVPAPQGPPPGPVAWAGAAGAVLCAALAGVLAPLTTRMARTPGRGWIAEVPFALVVLAAGLDLALLLVV